MVYGKLSIRVKNKMKLNLKDLNNQSYIDNNYKLPQYDIAKMRENTLKTPKWIHFGAGNIFRAYPAKLHQFLLNKGLEDTGIIVAEGFDYEIIDKVFTPFDLLTLSVILKADGTIEKEVIASIAEALKFDPSFNNDFGRIVEVFEQQSLQIASFTITEKGYELKNSSGQYFDNVTADFTNGTVNPTSYLGKVAYLLNKRYQKGSFPLTLVSMDNYSHNGTKLKNSILEIAKEWLKNKLVDEGFITYLENEVSYPWSMIDKITPRPDQLVADMLEKDGFVDNKVFITSKNTYVAPYVNAEEAEYLVIEDNFKNGRPKLDLEGVIFTDQNTVDNVEKMKVTTCLNPLHTALAIYGCLLEFDKISEEMKDQTLVKMIEEIGYVEGLPVVVDPKIINPKAFIDEVLNVRLPNPFMPDTPQRIATDTSQKLAIRFGETIKSYEKLGKVSELKIIPLVLAGWLKYLMGINDSLETFTISPDPLYDELSIYFKDINVGDVVTLAAFKDLLENEKIFGVNLVKVGLADLVISYFNELNSGKGAIRNTLNKYLG